ncbi:MAG: hypothetical protein ACFE0R_03305 [Salinarimonas sp.]
MARHAHSAAQISPPAPRIGRLAAAAVLAGALAACSPYGPGAATGSIVGNGALLEREAVQERVACEYDPLYGRDVCYRY